MVLLSPLSSLDNTIVRRVRHVFTLLSLIFALLTVFIILSCKDRPSKKYSRLVLAIVSVTLMSDVYLQIVFDPIFFFPVPCVARDDPWLNIPGRASIHYDIWAAMTVLNSPMFLACFIYRHQAVMTPGSRWSFSPRIQNIPPLLFALLVFIFPILLQRTMQSPGAVGKYVEMLSPDWPSSLLDRTDCFYTDRLLSFSIVAAIGLIIGMIFVSMIISHTFATLKKKSAISDKMKEYHRTMTRVLLLQSGIPTLFALVPLSVCFSVFFLNLNGILIIPTCFVFISAHSFLHSLAVIFTTPIYRRQFGMLIRETDIRPAITAKQETSSVTPRLECSPKFQRW